MLFVSTGDWQFTLQLISWLNVICFASYGGPVKEVYLDYLIMIFPFINASEVVWVAYHRGSFAAYFEAAQNPALKVPRAIGGFTTACSFCIGIPIHLCHLWGWGQWLNDLEVRPNIARFFLSLATLVVFTRNETFAKMMRTFLQASRRNPL